MNTKKHRRYGSPLNKSCVPLQLERNRREFIAGATSAAVLATLHGTRGIAQSSRAINIARVAIPTGYAIASENKISAVNDDFSPGSSFDRSHGYYALRSVVDDAGSTPWAQYEWSMPVSIDKVEVYWAVDRPRPANFPGAGRPTLHLPVSYRLLYWNGTRSTRQRLRR